MQNSIWNLIEVLLGPAILFISIPIFLKQLGAEDYGIWMFVNAMVIVMQAFNLGLSFSTYKNVSIAISEKNNEQISRTLNTNLSVTVLILGVCLIASSFICLGIYNFDWFIENEEVKPRLITAIFIGMALLTGKLTEQILYNVYRAFENFKYVTILSILMKTIIVVGNIIIAVLTQNVVYVLLFSAIVTLLGIILNYKLISRFVPGYKFKFLINKKLVKHEISYSFFIWIQGIAVIIVYQGDKFLVSYKFGLAALSFYAIVATLFNHIHMAFAAMTSWVFPKMAKNKDDKEFIFDLYNRTKNISIVLSVFLLSLFCLVSKPLFTIWLGADNYLIIADYIKWFSIFEFFFIFTHIPLIFLNASDNERLSLKIVVIYAFINFSGMLIGLFVFKSITAMLIGQAISIIPGMYWMYYIISFKFDKVNHNPFVLFSLFIPSFFGSGIAFFDDYVLKLICFVCCLLSMFIFYFKLQKTNFKIMVE